MSRSIAASPMTGDVVAGGIVEQARQCFENIKTIVEHVHHVMDDVVRITIFVKNISDMDAVDEVFKSFFSSYFPARTTVAVAALPMGALVQIEALVSHGEGTIPGAPQAGDLIKVARNTVNAPASSVSSQSVAFSHYNNISAQLPIDAKTGERVVGGAVEQAKQCFENIKAILQSIDHVMNDIVRITIFANNGSSVESAKKVFAHHFPSYVPALTAVEVSALPMGASVQDIIARPGSYSDSKFVDFNFKYRANANLKFTGQVGTTRGTGHARDYAYEGPRPFPRVPTW